MSRGCGLYLQPAGKIDYAIRKVLANTVAAGDTGGSCDLRFRTRTSERDAELGARPVDEAGNWCVPATNRASGARSEASLGAYQEYSQGPGKDETTGEDSS